MAAVLVFLEPERLRAPPSSAHAQVWDAKTMSGNSVVVGIDVAKAHVDCAALGAQLPTRQFTNDTDGHSALAAALQPLGVALVVMPMKPILTPPILRIAYGGKKRLPVLLRTTLAAR